MKTKNKFIDTDSQLEPFNFRFFKRLTLSKIPFYRCHFMCQCFKIVPREQCDLIIGKYLPMFGKIAKTSEIKRNKIFTPKLNLKAKNTSIKPLLKPENTYSKPCFESAQLVENVSKLHL